MEQVLQSHIVRAVLTVSFLAPLAVRADQAAPRDKAAGPSKVALAEMNVEYQSSSSRRSRRPTTYKVVEVKVGGTITGTITYKGKMPAPRKIQIVKDHESCGKHPTEVPLMTTNGSGRVAQAVAYLANIKEGKDFPEAEAKPRIDQNTCEFHPHIQVVRAKEEVEIVNSDPVAHNINASQRIYTLFNILQPQQGMKAVQKFAKPGVVNLKCNVHDWMQGYVHVALHPYYQLTGADGAFRLENVPPGKYELAVWQEYLGEQTFPVEVKAGETSDMQIVLKPKEGEESDAR